MNYHCLFDYPELFLVLIATDYIVQSIYCSQLLLDVHSFYFYPKSVKHPLCRNVTSCLFFNLTQQICLNNSFQPLNLIISTIFFY